MPQRFLRPGLRTSPRWNAVSHRAARIFIAILNLCDDYGRYDGRASVLWADTFSVWNEQNPGEQVTREQTAADCEQLAAANLIEFYDVEGRKYLQVVQWHETPRNKSKWPEPRQPLASIQPPLVADSCRNLPPSSSPSSSYSPAPAGEPTHANGEIPTEQEVMDYAPMAGALPDSAKRFFDHHQGNALWLNGYGRLIDWRHKLRRWATDDRQKQPAAERDQADGYACGLGKKLIYTLKREPRLEDFNGDPKMLEWAKEGYLQWKQVHAKV